jgi:hypothetical protein
MIEQMRIFLVAVTGFITAVVAWYHCSLIEQMTIVFEVFVVL